MALTMSAPEILNRAWWGLPMTKWELESYLSMTVKQTTKAQIPDATTVLIGYGVFMYTNRVIWILSSVCHTIFGSMLGY